MIQIAKTLISTALVVVFTVLPLSVFTDSFHYDFDVLEEDDWELWGSHSKWRVKDGFLRTTIQVPDFSLGLFQVKGKPGNYESFEIFANDRVIQKHAKKPRV